LDFSEHILNKSSVIGSFQVGIDIAMNIMKLNLKGGLYEKVSVCAHCTNTGVIICFRPEIRC
jgi:hypothetical protein